MKLLLNNLETLYTNVDGSDVKQEYLKRAENVRLRNGYVISEGLKFTPMSKPEGEVLWLDAVEFDEDRLKTKVIDGKIVEDYTQNIINSYLLIVKPVEEKVRIYLYLDNQWEEIVPIMGRFDELTVLNVVNINGIVKIYCKEETLWLGKISRHWKQLNNISQIYNGFYLDRLIEPFDKDNFGIISTGLLTIKCAQGRRLGIGLLIDIITNQSESFADNLIEKTFLERSTKTSPGTLLNRTTLGLEHSNAVYNLYRFRDTLWDIIIKAPTPSHGGYYLFFEPWEGGNTGGPNENFILIPKRFFIPGDTYYHLKVIDEIWQEVIDPFIDMDITRLKGTFYRVAKDEFLTTEIRYVGYEQVEDAGFEALEPNYEILVTATEDYLDEYVIYYTKSRIEIGTKYAFKLRYLLPSDMNKRTTNLSFYLRSKKEDDFEQVKIIDLLNKEAVNQFYIHSESPNGTFLVQTIGSLFDIDTFKLLHLPDDASPVDGIHYIIKGRNIYHSAVGGGKILENTYYPGNIVPSIEGNLLLNINGYPAIADLTKPKITLLSVIEDEGIFLFSTKDQWSYEIKDAYDIAEMPEGILLNTRQGIILTNGESSQFISEPINDICEKNFGVSSIYFDRLNGELFYVLPDKIYRYWSLGNNWTEFVHIGSPEFLFSPDGTKIAIQGESLSKVIYEPQRAVLETHSTQLGVMNIAKIVNFIRFDFKGILKFNEKEVSLQDRGESTFKMKLNQRIPSTKLKTSFEFEGIFYGMEVDYELVGELIK